MISKTKKERRRVELLCVIGVSENESHSVPLQPHGLYSPWNSPGQNTGMGSLSLLQEIFPTQGLNPGLTTLQVDSLPAVPQEKPKNTGVGSLSLLQWISLTQESNQGLLHCRQILYQLSIREALGLSCYQLKMDDFSCKMFYGSLGVITKAKTYSRFTHMKKNGIIVYQLENHQFIKVGREEKGDSGATKKLPGNN